MNFSMSINLYVPVVENTSEEIEYDEAVTIVEGGLAPLGEDYIAIFKEGIKNRWVDVYENKGKRTGAYSWGKL